MSILGRRIPGSVVAMAAAVMVVAALLPVMTKTPSRDVTLVVRGMAFYLDGDFEHPNPAIEAKAGERIRVIVRNEERGVTHDFAVPAVGASTDLLGWHDADQVTFEVPATPGTYEYVCNPHRLMMSGRIVVR
jgi:plastocyanin